jgi:quercetin dioxygenase-like cupin family protein
MSATPVPNPEQPGDALAGKLKRTELQHSASSIPGREIVQVLTEIPCGTESGWHIHPGEEVGFILAGTVQMMIQGKPTWQNRSSLRRPSRVPTHHLGLSSRSMPVF